MAVLGVFCEDIDFPNGVALTVVTTAGKFRNGFARCALEPTTQGLAKSTVFPSGEATSCWLTVQTYTDYGSSPNNRLLFGLGKSGTSSGIFVGTNGTNNGKLCLTLYDGTTFTQLAQTATSCFLLDSMPVTKVDLQLISYGSSGTLNAYVGGAFVLSYTGDITIPGVTGFDSVFVGLNGNTQAYLSEFLVASDSTLGVQGIDIREITANGTTQQFNNPDISNFDQVNVNTLNSAYSNTAGQDEQAALANGVAGNYAIAAVKIAAYANAPAGSAINNLKLGLRNTGGTVAVGAAHALSAGYTTVEDILTVDPTTGQPFTSIDGYQLDLRSA